MKSTAKLFFFIILGFEPALTKQFSKCEFVKELHRLHEIPKEDIYKHLCIAQSLHTGRNSDGFLGLYGIGSQWWCGKDKKGGDCNVKCSNLIDDDIADDVQCANLIFSNHGFQGWLVNEDHCRSEYEEKANECLAEIDDETQSTTSKTEIIATANKPVSIDPSATKNEEISKHEQIIKSEAKCSCRTQNIFLTIIVLVSFALLITILVKFQRLKRYIAAKCRDHSECENALAI